MEENSDKKGVRLKEARKRKGLNQVEFGRAIGLVGTSSVSMIERGDRNLTTQKLFKAAEVLEVSIEWLEKGENPPSWMTEEIEPKQNSQQITAIDPFILEDAIESLSSDVWGESRRVIARAIFHAYQAVLHRG